MITLLNESILWWHWIVFGTVLLILELTTGTFFMLALGVAAIIVGLLSHSMNISFALQISIWMVLSILAIMVWVKWFKEKPVSNSGQSNYRLDTIGTVSHKIQPNKRGKVSFDTPVLGNTSWHATSKVDIDEEVRVEIVQVKGQLIEVKPISN